MTKSGIYFPNREQLTPEEWDLLRRGRFTWAVARLDLLPGPLWEAKSQGLTIIMQCPDHFHDNPFSDPAERARALYQQLTRYAHVSDLVVLDNEPNLTIGGCSRWHAEQFCRWYRALVAEFRFYDPGSRWQLLFPALVTHPGSNWRRWLEVNQETIAESDGVAWHSYWQTPAQLQSDDWALSFDDATAFRHGLPLYITEYANSSPLEAPERKADQYRSFLRHLPERVPCACYFILGGTEDWRDFALTPELADALATAEEDHNA